MIGQGKLTEKWAEMTLEANKLCTLDNHPQPEGLSSGFWPIYFSILILLNSIFINICTMREIAQFKPVQFLHLMLMRVAIFSKWEHALTSPWGMCPKQLVYYLEMTLESESRIFNTELCFIFDVCIYDIVLGGNIISASSGESWRQVEGQYSRKPALLVPQTVKKHPQCRRHRFNVWVKDLLEKEVTTTLIFLLWKIPWTEEPGGLQSMG